MKEEMKIQKINLNGKKVSIRAARKDMLENLKKWLII